MARGADIPVHEVIGDAGHRRTDHAFQSHHRKTHTTATDLARLATEAGPGLLVLHHGLHDGLPADGLIDEVRAVYDGPVTLANDLDRFSREILAD